jgi:hypothetical protein
LSFAKMPAAYQRALSLRPLDSSDFAAIAFFNAIGISHSPGRGRKERDATARKLQRDEVHEEACNQP